MKLALLLILSFPLWAQFQNVPSTRYPGLEAILNAKPAAQVAAGVPSGNCTVGKDFYVNSTAHTLYYCSATNTWVQIAGATASTTVNGTTCTLGSTCTVTATPTAHATTHAAGGTDAVTLTEAQITSLTSDLSAKAASNAATTVNSQSCALGSTCTVTATPTAHATSHATGGTDAVTLTEAQITSLTTDLSAKAALASPTFTGTPAAPTASVGTNTTQIATTAYVQGQSVTINGTSCAINGSCTPTFPGSSGTGSIIVSWFNNSATAALKGLNGGLGGGCAGSTATNAWPTDGTFRSTTITTDNTNGPLWMRGNISADCTGFVRTAVGPSPGGALVPPAAAAGSFVDTATHDFWHVNRGGEQAAGWVAVGSVTGTAAQVNTIALEFLDDAGQHATIIPAGGSSSPTASSTVYGGFYGLGAGGGFSATELPQALPVPFAGTLGPFTICTSGSSPTNNETVTLNKNGVATAITVTITAADPATSCYADLTHTVSVAAGDYIDLAFTAGASTVSGFGTWAIQLIPGSGSHTMIGGSIGTNVSTTINYSLPGTRSNGTTLANMQLGLPIACTASHLYVTQSAANAGGVTTTFTLLKNGSDTALTGTVTSASGTGSLALDTSDSVSFAKGDLMSLKYVTGSGSSGNIAGWSIQCN